VAGTTEKGTSLEGLAKAAKALGLKAEGVQVSREALARIEMPAIAWVNGNHYIAALSVRGEGDQGTALIHDPNAAREQTIPQEQLLRQCSGYLLLVHR
jgi:ABC-type bacteriocin/lantibiotic exporter with double-glycine peptidase domain